MAAIRHDWAVLATLSEQPLDATAVSLVHDLVMMATLTPRRGVVAVAQIAPAQVAAALRAIRDNVAAGRDPLAGGYLAGLVYRPTEPVAVRAARLTLLALHPAGRGRVNGNAVFHALLASPSLPETLFDGGMSDVLRSMGGGSGLV